MIEFRGFLLLCFCTGALITVEECLLAMGASGA